MQLNKTKKKLWRESASELYRQSEQMQLAS
jgi:hypothetical protein